MRNSTPAALVAEAQNPAHLLARLKSLAEQAGKNVFDRAAVAAQLLADRRWIADTFHGDQGAARDCLQEDYFGDLCGTVTLGQILHIYRKLPAKGQWEDLKFNLMKLLARADEADARPKGNGPRQNPAPPLPEMGVDWKKESKRWEKIAEKRQAAVTEKEGEVAALKRRVADLEAEVGTLRQQVAELSRNNNG